MSGHGVESSAPAAAISVWLWGLDNPAPMPELSSILSEEELARARRYRREIDRMRFVTSRGGMRKILGDFLGVPPQDLRFGFGPFGKPYLVWPSETSVRFNLAHSGSLAILAISEVGEVGVDVECSRKPVNSSGLANRFFSPEEAAVLSHVPCEEQVRLFLRFWTCKEAVLKAIGVGLTLGLEKVVIPWLLEEPSGVSPPVYKAGEWEASPKKLELVLPATRGSFTREQGVSQRQEWWIWEWRPAPDYFAAVACSYPWHYTLIRWWPPGREQHGT